MSLLLLVPLCLLPCPFAYVLVVVPGSGSGIRIPGSGWCANGTLSIESTFITIFKLPIISRLAAWYSDCTDSVTVTWFFLKFEQENTFQK